MTVLSVVVAVYLLCYALWLIVAVVSGVPKYAWTITQVFFITPLLGLLIAVLFGIMMLLTPIGYFFDKGAREEFRKSATAISVDKEGDNV